MDIPFDGRHYPFRPWKPQLGRVFDGPFALDTETTLIDEERPWVTPAYVIGAAFDGKDGYFISRDHMAAFWQTHAESPAVFHNAAFDLDVLRLLSPETDVYAKVDADAVMDTWILHKLYVLATAGHTAGGRDESTLETCAWTYLGVELPKDVTDADGYLVRTSFGRFLGRPPSEIPPVYLEYLATDPIATFTVYQELRRRIDGVLDDSRGVWGYVSDAWLDECRSRFGPLTHHIQLRAAIVLKEITRCGLHIDTARRDLLVPQLEEERGRLETRLREQGVIVRGPKSQAALQVKFGKLAAAHPGVMFPRTEDGRFATNAEALHELAGAVPFAADLLRYRAVDKLLETFLAKLVGVVHPSFHTLMRTGRTSSYGALNAQNLPRDDRVRNCFVPSEGHVFVDADYSTIELGTLAQACRSQFGWESEMLNRINAGDDLHRVFAGYVTGKPPGEVTKHERDRVKPINFGKPGGMGNRALKSYAEMTYNVTYTEEEVATLSAQWLDLFPEMERFLTDTVDVPLELARAVGLTPAAHFEHTDDPRMVRIPENADRAGEPSAVLGAMCLKVLGHDDPHTAGGRPYTAAELDFFWSRLETLADALPAKFAREVRNRAPSKALQRAVSAHVGRAGVFVLTGRLRAAAGYTARHNSIFQGLASDGAKLALWKVWRAGYTIVNFIHDQLLVEVPAGDDLGAHAEAVKGHMIAGMKEVLPDVRVEVEYAATDRWRKGAKPVRDAAGRLQLWFPPGEPAETSPPRDAGPGGKPLKRGRTRARKAVKSPTARVVTPPGSGARG